MNDTVDILKSATKVAQFFVNHFSNENLSLLIDATLGNGNDSFFLSSLNESSGNAATIIGIDIQSKAIEKAKENMLSVLKNNNISFVQGDHSKLDCILQENDKNNVDVFMYNLGYLPGASHEILTHADTTIRSLKQATFDYLSSGGIITIVVYQHEEGQKEIIEIKKFCKDLTGAFNAYEFKRLNRNNPPYVIIITKD